MSPEEKKMLTENEVAVYQEAMNVTGDGRVIHDIELIASIRLEEKKMEEGN